MTMSTVSTAYEFVRSADCLLVVNPAAAGVDVSVVVEVERRLFPHVGSLQTTWTDPAGAATALAAGHCGLVVALGGDGTVADLAQGMVGSSGGGVLCALPAGSGNSTARNLMGDLDWRECLDALLTPYGCSLGEIDALRLVEPNLTAVLGTSTGFLAEVLIGAAAVDPGVSGIARYHAAAGQVMRAMPAHPTRVSVDGVVISDGPTASVAVGGGRFRARAFQFLPHSLLDDGRLDVSTIAALAPTAVPALAALLPAGAHLDQPGVQYAQGQSVVIERTDGEPLVAEYDGSVLSGAGPRLTVQIQPAALRVLTAAGGAIT